MAANASLQDRINTFLQWLFADYRAIIPREPKIINDSLLGNQFFAKHEIAVINSPLLQRLKRIKQTGLVYHVFPSATHSRFEHCLGAVTLAERCFNAVRDRMSVERGTQLGDPDRLRGDLAHLRMAALLHDVGHGLCSHASEQIYKLLSDLREFSADPAYAKNAPGEILSYLIITSPVFRSWFDFVMKECRADINLDVVAQMVLGKHDDPERFFLAQVISSPYDADKLDYIARDSYYCGLALTVDLARFYGMISTTMVEGKRVLVLRNYVPLEQILFSKMTLFGSVYHHQKVKCLDSMLRCLIQHINENADQCAFSLAGMKLSFAEPVEYLYVTDDEFFAVRNGFGDEYVRKMLRRFALRDLFVRCLEVSRRTVKNWDDYPRKQFIDLSELPYRLADIERKIYAALPQASRTKCNLRDVCLSVPGVPSLKKDFAYVQIAPDLLPEPIEQFFPVTQWTDAYAHNKWKGFVYAPREVASSVRDAANSVLQEETGIDVDLQRSNQACHLT